MRAITGAVISTKPCSLAKAARILALFADSAASVLPSSDAATYLCTATEAASEHHVFRRDLRRYQQGINLESDAGAEGVEDEGNKSKMKKKKHQRASVEDGARNVKEEDDEGDKRTVLAANLHGFAAEQGIAAEKMSKKKKGAKEDQEMRDVKRGKGGADVLLDGAFHTSLAQESKKKKKHAKEEHGATNVKREEVERAGSDGGMHGSMTEHEIAAENKSKKKKKKKHAKEEDEMLNVKEKAKEKRTVHNGPSHGFVGEDIGSVKEEEEEKTHMREKEEARDVEEVEGKMVHGAAVEQGLTSEEKERKKKKRVKEEEDRANVKEKQEMMVVDGDLDSFVAEQGIASEKMKKKKKKRGREDDNDNDEEQVEHTKKKRQKQSRV